MKVCFMCGREPSYTRNAVILKGLRENNVEVLDCTDSSGGYATRYPKVLGKFLLSRGDFDIIFIGFFGQPLVPLVEKIVGKPVVFDAFISAYDTLCFDRKTFSPTSVFGKFFYWLDRYSCKVSDKVLLDTNAHVDYFVKTFDLDRRKFQRVWVGADDSVFYPRRTKRSGKFRVFYYSTFLSLHGVEHVIKAAKILEKFRDLEFKIVGRGPEYEGIVGMVNELGLSNIKFIDWLPLERMPHEIAEADVCLAGHFSGIDKAKRAIPGKAYQFIAMKKPIILGNNAANRELFKDRVNAMFCEIEDAGSLADSILELKGNKELRDKISENGYRTFKKECTPKVVGAEIKKIMEKLI